MSGFDEKTGTVNLRELLPKRGDMILISHCGDHYEIKHQSVFAFPPLLLTDEDLEMWRQGLITWN